MGKRNKVSGPVIRWKIDITSSEPEKNKVLFYYSKSKAEVLTRLSSFMKGVPMIYTIEEVGHVRENGSVYIPPEHQGKVLVDVAPSRETRK